MTVFQSITLLFIRHSSYIKFTLIKSMDEIHHIALKIRILINIS